MTTPALTVLAVSTLLAVSMPGAASATQSAPDDRARLQILGHVVDYDTGAMIPGASVTLSPLSSDQVDPGVRVSDDGGRFRYSDVPEGLYGLEVTAPGYVGMVDSLEVRGGRDLEIRLPLSTDAVTLHPVVLPPQVGPERAYQERRRRGNGFLITREKILERRVRFISELLHEVPGGTVVPSPPYGYRLLLRGQCAPGIWVDGSPMPGAGSVDQVVRPGEVEAVEVYHALEFPVEYGTDECGGILVWTRRGQTIGPAGAGGGGSALLGGLVKLAAIAAIFFVIAR